MLFFAPRSGRGAGQRDASRHKPERFLSEIFRSELDSGLQEASAERLNQVDTDYLRDSVLRDEEKLLKHASDDVDRYLRARSWLVSSRLASEKPPKPPEPRPELYRGILLIGLGLLLTSGFMSDPGVLNAYPQYLALTASAVLLTSAAVVSVLHSNSHVLNRGYPLRKIRATLVAAATAAMFLDLTTVSKLPKESSFASQSATVLVIALPCALVLLIVPFLRWKEELPGGSKAARIGLDYEPAIILAMTTMVFTLGALLVQSTENRELTFSRVELSVAVAGLLVCLGATFLALITFRTQPYAAMCLELRQLDDEFRKKLKDVVIVPQLRTIADAQIDSFETSMLVGETPGLSQTLDPLFQVSTQAVDRLTALLDTMPGGSIGIAGPRGAGKSSLIDHLCASSSDDTLSVTVSAPVEYLPRDFLLHLYGKLCETIIGPNQAGLDVLDPVSTHASRRNSVRTFIYGTLLLAAGAVLLFSRRTMCYSVPSSLQAQSP